MKVLLNPMKLNILSLSLAIFTFSNTGVHRIDLFGIWTRVLSMHARPQRSQNEGVRAVLQATRRKSRVLELIRLERETVRHSRSVRKAGLALQRLQWLLRRVPKLP